MSVYRQSPSTTRGRPDFCWDRGFCVRQRKKYEVLDRKVLKDSKVLEEPEHKADLLKSFFDEDPNISNPPCYNYVALKEFLKRADPRQLNRSRPVLALIDDRRDHSGLDGSMRNWDSDDYALKRLEGHDTKRSVFDEGGLFRKLRENVWKAFS